MRQRLHAGDRAAADDQRYGADGNDQIEQSEGVQRVRQPFRSRAGKYEADRTERRDDIAPAGTVGEDWSENAVRAQDEERDSDQPHGVHADERSPWQRLEPRTDGNDCNHGECDYGELGCWKWQGCKEPGPEEQRGYEPNDERDRNGARRGGGESGGHTLSWVRGVNTCIYTYCP